MKTDMRDVEGLQTEPDYPTVGFVVCKGRGNHTKLDTSKPLEILFTKELKRGDGVYLELGALDAIDDRYVLIPSTGLLPSSLLTSLSHRALLPPGMSSSRTPTSQTSSTSST